MSSPMTMWRVEYDSEGEQWVVLHYVGGEDPEYIYSWYNSEEQAEGVRDALNEIAPMYHFESDGDGGFTCVVEGLPDLG